MRLLENKELPRLVVNTNGRILQMNISARKSLKELDVGHSIYDIIDADVIRKLSMYKKKLEIIRTSLGEFPLALLKITEKTRTKSIEIVFHEREITDERVLEDAKRMMEIYSDKNIPKSNTCIDMLESLRCIFGELSKRKELLGIATKIEADRTFFAKLAQPQAELLFLSTAFVVGEINPASELKVIVNEGRVELVFKAPDKYIANSITELLYLYPQLAPRLLLIDEICEDEFVKITVSKRAGYLKLIYDIPQGKENELIVKIKMADVEERISAFIDTLSIKTKKSAN